MEQVCEVPMADGEPTGFGEVSVSASAALEVSEEEEDKDEDAELGNSDDEEDMDDINHANQPTTIAPSEQTRQLIGVASIACVCWSQYTLPSPLLLACVSKK
jgi:hypothetical protein